MVTTGTDRTSIEVVLDPDMSIIRPLLVMIAGAGVNVEPEVDVGRQSTYTVFDYANREVLSFSSAVFNALSSDREFVIARIVDGVDDNIETPIDFTARRSGSSIIFTATSSGAVVGLWSVVANHGGGGGNLAFTAPTVVRSGSATFTGDASFPGGTLTGGDYTSASPIVPNDFNHNFIGERVVFWGEGQTNLIEPEVSTDTDDYSFTRLT